MTDFDPTQLRDLYDRHRQGLFTLALSVTRCRARAEDAVHEAFVRLCDGADDGVDGVADPVAYSYRAVRFAAIDQVRRYWPGGLRLQMWADRPATGRNGPRGSGASGDESIFERPAGRPDCDPVARSADAELAERVARTVDELPGDQREAVVLKVYAGLTFAQIAAVTGDPLPTVAARYRRALDRLRPRLEALR